MSDKLNQFSVEVYGNLEPYNKVISKARVRIFYGGENRNGAYVTSEFADKLIKTLPYTPIKGIYDSFNDDFSDHGARRAEGRIYGIVPENPNFAWEEHQDSDGVTRTYGCSDVLIFSALYEEANSIVGKAQSMELYTPSIKGSWQFINGKRLYVYTDACFLGLQILGEDVEPCFEGAAFFSFCDSLKGLVENMERFNLQFEKTSEETQMIVNYKLSDNQKHMELWSLLNPNCTEEGNWEANYEICEVYDNYAVCWNYESQIFERVYYTKDDEKDTVEITSKEQCFIVDVTAAEKESLRLVQALNENTFENLDKKLEEKNQLFEQVGNLNEKISEFEQKKEEYETQIATFNTEKETLTQKISELESDKNSLQEEVGTLSEYKANIERQEKKALVDSYSNKLDQTTLDQFNEEVDKYTYEALERELAYTLVKSNPSNFSLESKKHYIPKDNDAPHGINAILEKYTNK